MSTNEPELSDLHELETRYEMVRELRRTEECVDYVAGDRTTGRLVVIELASPRGDADTDLEELRRMATATGALVGFAHPNLVRLDEVITLTSGAVVVVRGYLEPQSLAEVIAGRGELPVGLADRVMRDVGRALEALHGRGLVHRDVRPEHILLDPEADAGAGRAILGGLSSVRPANGLTALGAWESAQRPPHFLSPEQIEGRPVDARSDLFSLGLVAWATLTGRRPWAGHTVYAAADKQVHEELPAIASLRDDVPAALESAITGALRKSPSDRWPTARAVLDVLGDGVDERARRAGYEAGVQSPARSTQPIAASLAEVGSPVLVVRRFRPRAREDRRTRHSPVGAIVAVAALLAVAAGSFYVFAGGRHRVGPPTASAGDVPVDSVSLTTLPRDGRQLAGPAPDPSALGTTTMTQATILKPAMPRAMVMPGSGVSPVPPPARDNASAARSIDDSAATALADSLAAARRRRDVRDSIGGSRDTTTRRDTTRTRRDSTPPDTTARVGSPSPR